VKLMKHDDRKHFDISKPRRHGPDPTSKPIIVGHHPMMSDPMIREEREKAARPIRVISDGETPESLSVERSEETVNKPSKPDNLPDLSDISAPHETRPALTPTVEPIMEHKPPIQPSTSESSPGAVFAPSDTSPTSSPIPTELKVPSAQPVATAAKPLPPTGGQPIPTTPTEPTVGDELHIPAGNGHTTVHHKPRIWVWVIMVLVILAWAYAAVDVLSGIKLPFEFF
jgi:hypothetical protein